MKRGGPLKRGVWNRKASKNGSVTQKTTTRRRAIRVNGVSSVSVIKREIQALLRACAQKRDLGCVLAQYPETGACAGPLQAEHLRSRQHSNTYADMRNIVCLCQRHHIFWKPQNSRLYWNLIEKIIGPARWDWYLRAEADNKPYHMTSGDWKLTKIALEQELKTYA